jgi:hypothetical protein
MAEMLIMNHDKGLKEMDFKAGMIIEIRDGQHFGPGRQQHPSFSVLRCPNITKAELDEFAQFAVDKDNDDAVIARRKDVIDFSKLPSFMRARLITDRDFTTFVGINTFRAWMTRKHNDKGGRRGR